MLEVGLTGGIACGKTVVRKRLAERGVATLDADAVVHALLGAGTPVTRAVAAAFGEGVLRADGSVDRRALGAIVFRDPKERERLEAIVHPEVWRAIRAFFDEAREEARALAVVDAALMVETGSYRNYDRIVIVYCPPGLQRKRLMERDGLTSEQAEERIAAQMPIDEKRKVADFVIDTSGTIDETLARTDEVLQALLDSATPSD